MIKIVFLNIIFKIELNSCSEKKTIIKSKDIKIDVFNNDKKIINKSPVAVKDLFKR